jgi:hypothetical protein
MSTSAPLTKITYCEATMATLNVTQRTEIYETLSGINLAFGAVVDHLQTMQHSRILTPKHARVLQRLTHELRARVNVELLESLCRIEGAERKK